MLANLRLLAWSAWHLFGTRKSTAEFQLMHTLGIEKTDAIGLLYTRV
jgi:hypothetical protein